MAKSIDSDFLEKTRQEFNQAYNGKINKNDAKEIARNVFDFFKLIHEWEIKDDKKDGSK